MFHLLGEENLANYSINLKNWSIANPQNSQFKISQFNSINIISLVFPKVIPSKKSHILNQVTPNYDFYSIFEHNLKTDGDFFFLLVKLGWVKIQNESESSKNTKLLQMKKFSFNELISDKSGSQFAFEFPNPEKTVIQNWK